MKRSLFLTVFLLFSAICVFAQGGKVFETRTLKSEILGMERHYSIYLPPGYDDTDESYPVLYLLHGSNNDHTGWPQYGQVRRIADSAIASDRAARMIIVMPDADTGVRGYFNNIQGTFRYEDFFFDELIPHIEKTYRVRTERRYRAVAGLSMGGGGTLYYAIHRPEMFAAAAPLSASTGDWTFEAHKARYAADKSLTEKQLRDYYNRQSIPGFLESATAEQLEGVKSVRWFISCGDDDTLYEGNSLMHIAFRKNSIRHEYRVKDGTHSWPYWRMELPFVLEFVSKSFTDHL